MFPLGTRIKGCIINLSPREVVDFKDVTNPKGTSKPEINGSDLVTVRFQCYSGFVDKTMRVDEFVKLDPPFFPDPVTKESGTTASITNDKQARLNEIQDVAQVKYSGIGFSPGLTRLFAEKP